MIVLVLQEVRGDASPFPLFFGPITVIFVLGWFANTPLIRKKGFGPKETQVALGNFNFPKATLTL